MKDLIQNFKFRKIMLAISDVFIISIASLMTNFVFNYSRELVVASIIMTGISCFLALFVCGAYNKLWRHFKAIDYMSCVLGVLLGIAASSIFYKLFEGVLPIRYAALHSLISIIGICLFRLIFKSTFIELTAVGANENKYKRTMIIGGGQTCKMLIKEIHNAQKSIHEEVFSIFHSSMMVKRSLLQHVLETFSVPMVLLFHFSRSRLNKVSLLQLHTQILSDTS